MTMTAVKVLRRGAAIEGVEIEIGSILYVDDRDYYRLREHITALDFGELRQAERGVEISPEDYISEARRRTEHLRQEPRVAEKGQEAPSGGEDGPDPSGAVEDGSLAMRRRPQGDSPVCPRCGKPLPRFRLSLRRYCDARCRKAAAKERGRASGGPSIIGALRSRKLFGALFGNLSTWRRWLIFLKAIYGLSMDGDEEKIFCEHTGRSSYRPPPGGFPEVVCVVGRQSGKSRVASLIAGFEAAMASRPADGSETYALLVAQDHRAALRTVFRYAVAPFEKTPALMQAVVDTKRESLLLNTGVSIVAYPCRPPAVRGIRAAVAVLDEMAFFRNSEGYPTDKEMLRAVRPTLATTGGKLIILSSPYGQSGSLWDLHRRHYGQDDSTTLVWQASARQMNPTLSEDYLRRMELEDPEAYRSEVLGEFRAGLSLLFDPEAVDACVVPGRRELAPADGVQYRCFADPSGGRGDSFALAVGHREDDRVVVDCVRTWPAPFNPTAVIGEAAELLKTYRVARVEADRFGGAFPVTTFRAVGIECEQTAKPKSDLYMSLLPAINSRGVELLDHAELLRELRGLERRRGPSGRDRVDHSTGAGAHDDCANSVAGLVVMLTAGTGEPARMWGMGRPGIQVDAPLTQDGFVGNMDEGWERTSE